MENKMDTGINTGYNEHTFGQKTPDAAAAEQPLISVIVPVYNTASLLPRSIDSILNQTHKNIELILVNDGSTDGSGAVCDEYAKRDARIRVIHQENGGESAARNAGWAVARGEWIGQVDSDDYVDLEMYEKLLRAATEQNTLLAACGVNRKQRNGSDTLIVFPEQPPKIAVGMVLECRVKRKFWVSHCAMLYHKRLINTPNDGRNSHLRYDTSIHNLPDIVFQVEVLLRAGELAYIPEALYIYDCTREDNITNSPINEKQLTMFIAHKKIIELAKPVSPNYARHVRHTSVREATLAMIETLLSEDANLNALYPECRRAAKGNMGLLLTDKRIKIKSKIVGFAVYLFPRFSRAAWKFINSSKEK